MQITARTGRVLRERSRPLPHIALISMGAKLGMRRPLKFAHSAAMNLATAYSREDASAAYCLLTFLIPTARLPASNSITLSTSRNG
eukprot:6183885-Pleurochrysis_carterae.AAC.2